ncbi:hypothetical protein Ddye_026253 [Dipteronia dyeriana]|uniref:Uncharacterized protein n=1 Tax=Dipteronia dyeriana TaxID=168575 RepID=A0AAD9TMC6_9ROSI|nr:hypothetical protein Ddye_026253 [Dipteronia dyeriana]
MLDSNGQGVEDDYYGTCKYRKRIDSSWKTFAIAIIWRLEMHVYLNSRNGARRNSNSELKFSEVIFHLNFKTVKMQRSNCLTGMESNGVLSKKPPSGFPSEYRKVSALPVHCSH